MLAGVGVDCIRDGVVCGHGEYTNVFVIRASRDWFWATVTDWL
jgi:hypothetical protein